VTTSDDPWGPVPDADPLDELASALLDGEAGDEELARADEPDVAARVAAFEAVARQVGAPVAPAPDADRDAAIAAALRAATPAVAATVPSLDAARERRAQRRRLPQWLPGVAAAVLAVRGLGLLVTALPDGDGGEDQASSDLEESAAEDTATEEGGDAGTFAEEDDAGAGGTGGESESAPTADMAAPLGDFDDVVSLEAELRALASSGDGADEQESASEQASAGREALARCQVGVDRVVRQTWSARFQGRDVAVAVFDDDSYVVVDVATCEELIAGVL
jgi:hypothetical protein